MKRLGVALMSALGLLAVGLSTTLPAVAQEKFPSKPIRIIVPYGPGGGTDIVARIVSEEMRQILGQPFLIENKPGANGLVALEELMKTRPDGYTLILANQTVNVIAPLLYPKRMKMNVETELAPVVRLADVPNALTFNKDFGPKTFAELIDYAKKNPGKVRYGSTGIGSFPHFDTEILAKRAGIDIVHIPNSKGAAAAATDLATGDVNVGFLNVATARPMVASGNIRVVGMADQQRHFDYPDTPTLGELGFPGVGTVQWFALLTHAGVPADVTEALHAAAVKALASQSVQEAFRKQGITARPSKSPADARAWTAQEFANWRKIFQEIAIKPED